MFSPRLRRLMYISRMFIKHDLDEFVQAIHLFRPYRYWLRLLPWNWRRRSIKPRAVRLRQALEELGPIFVKFGQVMSTRPDLLPEDIAEELSRLQDQVPPFAGDEAVALIEQAYGKRLHEVFSEFKREPVASASVAQVHFACLHDGTEVAVKVLRPGIWPVIERDLALLDTLASLAHRYSAEMRRLRPKEVVEEFRRTVHNELDMMREAANASQLAANFEGSSLLHVPKIYWDYCRREVLVMERIHGIQISDIDALKRANIDMRQLAHNGVEIFFTQAFRDGFFHADMHPGNIFVTPDGQYQAVDFGIMGTLGELDKRYLAENFIGFFNRNYRAVAEAHLRAGWIPRETRVEEFEAAIRAVCEPVFAKPIKDISFGQLLLNLFQTARQFQMEIQPQLVLLQKTMFQIEGLGRRLYPDLDLWVTAKPYLERWMREQMGPRAFIRTAKREFPKLWQVLPELPGLVYELMHREREGEAIHRWSAPELKELATVFKAQHRRQYFIWIGSAALVSAAVLYSFARLYGNDVVLSGLAIGAVSLGAILLLAAWPCKQ